jgi:tRNA G10  N-methylase Trm11
MFARCHEDFDPMIVIDPFSGTGSTAKGAYLCGLPSITVDQDKKCQVTYSTNTNINI